MCDPILATLMEMQTHYSQSSHLNATPFSSTSPLACYWEVLTRKPTAVSCRFVITFGTDEVNQTGIMSTRQSMFLLPISKSHIIP